MNKPETYADCILPIPLPAMFTYRVPHMLLSKIVVGMRVEVEFGSRKLYSALVRRIHNEKPDIKNVKSIRQLLDSRPLVNESQLKLWDWIADYYLCSPGELMIAALPPALKLSSESKVIINPEFDGVISELSRYELAIIENVITAGETSVTKIRKALNLIDVMRLVRNLVEKGVLLLTEEMHEKYIRKTESCLAASSELKDEVNLQRIFNSLEKRAPRQLEVLMTFYQLSMIDKQGEAIVKSELLRRLEKGAAAALDILVKKNLIKVFKRPVSRLIKHENTHHPDSIELNEAQKKAYGEMSAELDEKGIVLLHGITGSGKTEIYIKKINEVINEGKQVLFLLPEIALTSQVVNRLRKYFGDKVGVYHSKYNEHERTEIWNRVLDFESGGGYSILLGARSALFLPFSKLGLIIIDEEHDPSYKQQTPAPRYHARDAAIWLAKEQGAKVILGSATPSIESYFNASNNKYGLVKLNVRYGYSVLPEILVSDLTLAQKRKEMKSHFSRMLLVALEETIAKKQQAILFQNRRGFSAKMQCAECYHNPMCEHCDVSLTHHKAEGVLKCHYCSYAIPIPENCPHCGSHKLFFMGFGTQKIETELPNLIQGVSVTRMDLDTTKAKTSYINILNNFEDGKVDVLVGTQMVTKGLDFDNVALVGILNADNMITFPDFRAFERSYQLIAQVSGRAGRKDKKGKVIIQTRMPQHPVIKFAIENNYEKMYEHEIADRQRFRYPPYFRLIQLSLQHVEQIIVDNAAIFLAEFLRTGFGKRILGPEYPPVSRIRNLYLKNIMIKLEKNVDLKQAKNLMMIAIKKLESKNEFKNVKVIIDVDPV